MDTSPILCCPEYLALAYQRVAVRPSALLEDACRVARTTPEEIRRRDKRLRVVAARQVVCALLRSAGLSYPTIAALLKRDHSTVLYAVRAVETRRAAVLRVAQRKFDQMRRTGL